MPPSSTPRALRLLVLVSLLLLTAALACNLTPGPAQPAVMPPEASAPDVITTPDDLLPTAVTLPPTPTPNYDTAEVDVLLASMSLRDRVGQLFLLGYFDASPDIDIYEMTRRGRPGGVVLFAHNVGTPAETAEVVNSLQLAASETSGVPLLIAADQEGGIVLRLREGFAAWPNVMALAATGDLALAEQVGATMAWEMRAVGINMALAPVADVLSNPANRVISVRAFGGMPGVVEAFSEAVMRGLHAGGVIATAKHFPGHGGTLEDSHDVLPTDPRPLTALDDALLPFAGLVEAGIDVVMTAHVVYPAWDGDNAATFSDPILTGVLREQLGFDGLILSDALSMGAVIGQYTPSEAVERAIRAGVDMVTFGRGVSPEQQLAAIDHIVALVETGALAEERINAAARRVLALKARYGLLTWEPVYPAAVAFDLDAHQEVAFTVAANAMTLVRDRADLLPLDANARVTVIYPVSVPGVREAFQVYDPDVNLLGVSLLLSQADWDGALAAAADGGPVVVLTLDAQQYPGQGRLIAALPAERTLAVALRSPYDILTYPDVQTYLATYNANEFSLSALARALYGGAGTPGRLPVDLPGIAPNGFADWGGGG